MRSEVTAEFESFIRTSGLKLNNVAIVGGASNEPELLLLNRIYPSLEVTFLGVENPESDIRFQVFDLNHLQTPPQTFDLVICCQVLEHVWDISNAFENLVRLVNQDSGFLWINCPSSNMVHGSPNYFSAGYPTEFLTKNLSKLGMSICRSGSLGSRRLYYFTHALFYWPSEFELRHPLISYRPLRSYGKRFFIETILGFLGRAYALLLSSRTSSDLKFATESYVLARFKVQ